MKSDADAMLFNLTTHTSFPCKKPRSALYCEKNRGPQFGDFELAVRYKPFNSEKACCSYTNCDKYNIPRNSEGVNMLTNQKSNYRFDLNLFEFTIKEIEVWGVTFI